METQRLHLYSVGASMNTLAKYKGITLTRFTIIIMKIAIKSLTVWRFHVMPRVRRTIHLKLAEKRWKRRKLLLMRLCWKRMLL